jgi:hypothetical protein
LEKVGFNVILFLAIPHKNPLLSHRQSMIQIYNIIANDEHNEWSYVFEDDINILENIYLDEIIEYEKISTYYFYLGMCRYSSNTMKDTGKRINGHSVYNISNHVRGLHAVAFSRNGMKLFLNWLQLTNNKYIDMILETFSIKYPANVVRADLQSYIFGHLGIFFQDRKKFESIISNNN